MGNFHVTGWVCCALHIGCGGQAKTASDSGSAQPLSPPCDEAASVSYANFGEGFLVENCQGCHASTSADRHGAPVGVIFDTLAQAWDQADRILERSVYADSNTMPPAGGPNEDDLVRLEWWLVCAPEGT